MTDTRRVEGAGEQDFVNPKYKSYTLANLRKIPQLERLAEDDIFAIEVVGNVLPFKTNNYVTEQLINWDNVPNDPIFILNFPQREMLHADDFATMAAALKSGEKARIAKAAHEIRLSLNPHPAGQMEHNVPMLGGERLTGVQHKYRQTCLFFPSQGQTCHAYCTFCFRWPQFVGMDDQKFATMETEKLIEYLQEHPEVTDVLFTGGDPMVMKSNLLEKYIGTLLDADIRSLRTVRIGTKSMSYWPYKYTTDADAPKVLDIMSRVRDAGKHLAIMAHFNHPAEVRTVALKEAAVAIRGTGAQIRTQSPVMRNINDNAEAWAEMWQRQVDVGMIPYYMFAARDTGAQDYFAVPLVRAWGIFRDAWQRVSGIGRTVRGPSMSCDPGKVEVQGVAEINGEKVMILRMIQGRDPDWVERPFFAKYDDKAIWLDDLVPAFGEEKFFFSDQLKAMYERDEVHGHVVEPGKNALKFN